MPESDPSESTRHLYKSLSDKMESVPILTSDKDRHEFNVVLESFNTSKDKVRMEAQNFPYIRSALIDEAVARGDIIKEEVKFAGDATLTIDGEEYEINEMKVDK